MIIISSGMIKSGSGWYFNLINDLVVASGHQDVRDIREKFHLHFLIKYFNCNIGPISFIKLLILLIPHLFGNTFVVKTHSKPTKTLLFLMSLGLFKAIYIYRDPRDVVISVYDHGKKTREHGEGPPAFAQLKNIKDSILHVKDQVSNWTEWKKCKNVLLVRYEDLLAHSMNEMKRLSAFLDIKVDDQTLQQIIKKYDSKQLDTQYKNHLHFNKAVVGRFRQVMSPEDLALCNRLFGEHMPRMGYSE